MPELPEVETISRELGENLHGAMVLESKSLKFTHQFMERDWPERFCGHRINRIRRVGKKVCFEFSSGYALLVGLGMTGGFRLSREENDIKHEHVQFKLKSNGEYYYLSYVDPRRFGKFYFVPKSEIKEELDLVGDANELGLKEIFNRHRNVNFKTLLMNQKYFPGMGNYLASEFCARLKVSPLRRVGELSSRLIKEMPGELKLLLEEFISLKGASFAGGYRRTKGDLGEGKSQFLVYMQERCGRCGGTVKKVMIASRGTFYCPRCQQ